MTAAIEIYTRPGCGYCTAAKSLLTRKKAAFTEHDVATDPALAPADVGSRRHGRDLSADLHRRDPCRRLRRALRPRPRGQARLPARGREGQLMSADLSFTAAMVQMCSGLLPEANLEQGTRLIRRSRRGRRRLCADPRGQQHDPGQPQGAVRASRHRGRRSFAEGLSRARARTENPSPYRLAGAALLAGEGGQPFVPDRTRRHGAGELRQDPHVRCRSARRRELSRIRAITSRARPP